MCCDGRSLRSSNFAQAPIQFKHQPRASRGTYDKVNSLLSPIYAPVDEICVAKRVEILAVLDRQRILIHLHGDVFLRCFFFFCWWSSPNFIVSLAYLFAFYTCFAVRQPLFHSYARPKTLSVWMIPFGPGYGGSPALEQYWQLFFFFWWVWGGGRSLFLLMGCKNWSSVFVADINQRPPSPAAPRLDV